jgi:mannose-6-phosphate isomerase-like protein (cupin superfamily)
MESFTKQDLISIAKQNNIVTANKSKKELYFILNKKCILGYHTNIEHDTLTNTRFRKVLFTSPKDGFQVALMSIPPEGEIGEEIHPITTQFIRIEKGRGKAYIGCQTYDVRDGSALVIPIGVKHNVINTSKTRPLKLYSVYSNDKH